MKEKGPIKKTNWEAKQHGWTIKHYIPWKWWKKKAEVAILISAKIEFKGRYFDKGYHPQWRYSCHKYSCTKSQNQNTLNQTT